MEFETNQAGDITHVVMNDKRLDAAKAIQFKESIRSVVDNGADHILLDMSSVDFMDSSGLGALVSVMKYMGIERKLEIAGLTPTVEKVFKLTRMDEVFQVYRDASEALA